MTLTADYQAFLSTAKPELLSKDAQLHYVNTLSSFDQPASIVKHLAAQGKQLKKKQEKVISSIESADAISLDVETTIEFLTGGGAYLPGIEDNLLSDRIVVFPVVHIVRFDPNGKIQQIRQQWDQASLLRAVEVIGSRGRNWPIKEGQEQIKLIKRSTEDVAGPVDDVANKLSSTGLANTASTKINHPTNDPHASLQLFSPRSEQEREHREPSVPPRGSRRPPTRDWDELFVSGEQEHSPARSASPSKRPESVIAPKGGSGKNFAPSRLFDHHSEVPGSSAGSPPRSPDRQMKPHPGKYNHFDFYDGHDEPAHPPSQPRPKTKHQSQWDFSDFTTPAKVKQRQHAQSNAQFTIGEEDGTPVPRKISGHARPEADSHFELQDDGEAPKDNRPRHPRGPGNTSISHPLYTDHTLPEGKHFENTKNEVFKNIKNVSQKDRGKDFNPHFAMDDDPTVEPIWGRSKESTGASRNTNLKDRNKDFGAHWDQSDAQPGLGERSSAQMNRAPTNANQQKVVKTMEPSYEITDNSPATGKHKSGPSEDWGPLGKTNGKENRGINIKGDGMGGVKAAGRIWGIGDDDDTAPKNKPATASRLGKAYQSDLWNI